MNRITFKSTSLLSTVRNTRLPAPTSSPVLLLALAFSLCIAYGGNSSSPSVRIVTDDRTAQDMTLAKPQASSNAQKSYTNDVATIPGSVAVGASKDGSEELTEPRSSSSLTENSVQAPNTTVKTDSSSTAGGCLNECTPTYAADDSVCAACASISSSQLKTRTCQKLCSPYISELIR